MKSLSTFLAILAVSAGSAHAAVRVHVVAKVGDSPPGAGGATLSTFNAPYTDGNGNVGFTGNLSPSNNFVWYNGDVVWKNSDGLPDLLTGAEGTMGVSNSGNFIYSPSVNTNDAVWTANGVLLQQTDPAPDFPGMFNSFNSRPTMKPDGTSYWIAGIAATPTGSTTNRVFYKATPGGTIAKVFSGGEVISGFTLSTGASNFAYWISDNTLHHIHIVDTTETAATNTFVLVDGALVPREGSPTGQGANWQNFAGVSINNTGNYAFGGDDSGTTGSDGFVAYNGVIAIKEGDTIDGFTLAAGSSVGWVSINNLNKIAHIWNRTGFDALFVGDAANLATTSKLLLKVGDQIDVNGDDVADATVMDFEAAASISPGLALSDHNFVYVELTLRDIGLTTDYEAIVRVRIKSCAADIAPQPAPDGVVNVNDLLAVINGWGACPRPCPPFCTADVNHDCQVNVNDLLAVINGWGACP